MNLETSPQAIDLIKREYSEQTGKLVLSNCGLLNFPREILEMTWLEELVITNGETIDKTNSKISLPQNTLQEIPEEISYLKQLKRLRIGDNYAPWPINDIQAIIQLTDLEELDLSGNSIIHIPDLSPLQKLRTVAFDYNQITLEVTGLLNCQNIERLSLVNNQIDFISFEESKLPKLEELILNDNKIYAINGLERLPSLIELDLSQNQINDISFLRKTEKLEVLNLDTNQIKSITPLSGLKNLEILNIGDNKIESINPLKALTKLNRLFIYENLITDLSPLESNKTLDLVFAFKNSIQYIQPITNLAGLTQLDISNNPIEDCPSDVYQTNDIQQIRAFFDSQKRQKPPVIGKVPIPDEPELPNPLEKSTAIDDIKLIFVGNSGVGKTQLSKYFESGKLDKTRESTHGIRLNRWIPNTKTSTAFEKIKGKIATNIWDFGGQEYYHGTFRLFLSNFAVYVLLWEEETNKNEVIATQVSENSTEEIQHFPYEYWLDNIRHYAPTSPILLVQNKTDKDGTQRINTKILSDYQIDSDHYISLFGTVEKQDQKYSWGFNLFCDALSSAFEQVRHQELQRNQKSDAWLQIRDAVVEIAYKKKVAKSNPFFPYLKAGKYILIDDFNQACLSVESQLTETEIYTLPRWLHNSGVVIYFGNNPRLTDRVYLSPIWVTQSIYEILDQTIRKKEGIFSKQEIPQRKNIKRDTILELMKEMEIVFEQVDHPDHYVAPQYLPEHHPVEDLYAIAAKGLQQTAYFIRLPLYFFRKTLQRLIFFYGMSDSVSARYYWKKGILFEKETTRIIVKGFVEEDRPNSGVIIIGAEERGNPQNIQKEVFHIMTKILEDEDLATLVEGMHATKKNVESTIYHRSQNWTTRYSADQIPLWLQHMEVSTDGTNFVNYYQLCQANKNEELYIKTDNNKQLRIHDFALLVDSQPKRPLRVFFSYSHKDSAIMDDLSVHLAPLKRMEKIEVWSDRAIQAGDEWDSAIQENLENSDIVLFLISADFVASSYIWENEIPLAIKNQNNPNGSIKKVVPIYLRPFDFSGLEFASTEMIPKTPDGQQLLAISQWENRDEAYMEIAKALRNIIDTMN